MAQSAAKRSRHLAPGDKLGKYDLIRQIAVGGMAELYLARTLGIEGFEKLVVVKRILPQYVANASFVEMFLNEARLAATLHHPNIAQVYDIGVDEGDYFFAMEYVHGEDLDRVSVAADEQGVPLSLDASLTLIAHLCAALHYAHEKVGPDGRALAIVHRDVSPSNVLVSYDGAVKLVDFGIARAGTRPGKTTKSGLKGKIAYMSPEQCRSTGHLDRRSDIFSVGMLLYELTTGHPPFTGDSEYQVLEQIVNRDAPSPRTIVPEYPEMLERIVLTALARDPAARFPTALALQAALEDFAHERRLRVSPLVLSRLMSTLFPERLEEWDQAKSQGAFFVEQHVVRTLIEAGKTADGVPDTQPSVSPAPDDDPTAVTAPPPGDGTPPPRPASAPRIPAALPVSRASSPVVPAAAGRPSSPVVPAAAGRPSSPVVPAVAARPSSPVVPAVAARPSSPVVPAAAPRTSSPAVPAAAPRTSSPMAAAAPVAPVAPAPPAPPSAPMPVPGVPGAVPIVTMTPAVPGSLVSSSNAPVPVPAVADVTEFVRAPTSSGTGRRRSIALVAGALAIAGGIAAFIALRGGGPVVPTSGSASPAESSALAGEPAAAPASASGSSAVSGSAADSTTPTGSAPGTVTATATATPTATGTATATATATDTGSATATDTGSATATDTGSATDTDSDSPSGSAAAPKPSATPPPHHAPQAPHPHSHSHAAHHATTHHATKEHTWNADSPFMPVRESH